VLESRLRVVSARRTLRRADRAQRRRPSIASPTLRRADRARSRRPSIASPTLRRADRARSRRPSIARLHRVASTSPRRFSRATPQPAGSAGLYRTTSVRPYRPSPVGRPRTWPRSDMRRLVDPTPAVARPPGTAQRVDRRDRGPRAGRRAVVTDPASATRPSHFRASASHARAAGPAEKPVRTSIVPQPFVTNGPGGEYRRVGRYLRRA
jgi:hypothetical protein